MGKGKRSRKKSGKAREESSRQAPAARPGLAERLGVGHWELIAVAAVVAAGLAVRLAFLGRPISGDEAATVTEFAGHSWYETLTGYQSPNNHILHTILARMMGLFGGWDAAVIRVPAFIAGVLTLPAVWWVFRLFAPASAAVAATAFCAFSPSMVYFSTAARGYSIQVLLVVVALGLMVHLLGEEGAGGRRRLVLAVLLAVVVALGLYTIPTTAFAAVGLWLWAFCWLVISWRREFLARLGWLAGAGAGAVLLALLLYGPVIYRNGISAISANPFTQPLPLEQLVRSIRYPLINFWEYVGYGLGPLAAWWLLGPLMVVGMVWPVRGRFSVPPVLPFLLVGAAVLTLIQRGIAPGRTWMYFLPFLGLALVVPLTVLGDWVAGRLKAFAARGLPAPGTGLVLAVAFGVLGVSNAGKVHETESGGQTPQGRPAAETLLAHVQEGDLILADSPINGTLRYWLFMEGKEAHLMRAPWDPPDRFRPAEGGALWVVLAGNSRRLARWDQALEVLSEKGLTVAEAEQTATHNGLEVWRTAVRPEG